MIHGLSPRGAALAAVTVTAALVFSACGGSGGPSATAPSTTAPTGATSSAPTSPSPAPSTPASILDTYSGTIHVLGPAHDQYKQMFVDFQAAYPNIKLDIEYAPDPIEDNILSKWATGERPDLLIFHANNNWMSELNATETLVDLSDQPFVGRTKPGLLDQTVTIDGKVYGALFDDVNLDGIEYNKEVFAAAGVEIPTNYAELLAACKTLRAYGVDPLTESGGDAWPTQILAYLMWSDAIKADPDLVRKINRREVKWTDPRFVQAFEKFLELKDNKCFNADFLSRTHEASKAALLGGKAAMYPMLSGAISGLVAKTDLATVNKKIGFFGISAESPVMSWEGSEAFLVPQTGDATKQAVAFGFIDWLTGPYYAKYIANSNQFPVIIGFDDKVPVVPDALTQARAYFAKDGVAEYEQTLLAAVGDIDGAILEMLAGKKTPLQVAETIQKNFEENAKSAGLPGF